METKKIFDHYKAILDEMLEKPYYRYFLQNPNTDTDNSLTPMTDVNLYFGATRCAIVDRMYPYVAKFTIEQDESPVDPCEREERSYLNAVKAKLDYLFCECEFLGVYEKRFMWYAAYDIDHQGIEVWDDAELNWMREIEASCNKRMITVRLPLFGYRRADEFEFTIGDRFTEKEVEICHSKHSPVTERMCYLGVYVLRQYGEDALDQLCSFCMEEDINDIHGGNIGWVDGKLVLIDYAGYN